MRALQEDYFGGGMMGGVFALDPGPMARMEAVIAQEGVPGVVFQRVSEGESLKDIAKAWGVPTGRFTQWYAENHGALYEAALRVRADQLAHESLGIADGAGEDGVAQAKLQVETRLKLASHWDRARYGVKEDRSGQGITVYVDRTCGGAVAIEAPGGSKVMIANPGTEPRPIVTENSKEI